MTRALYDTPEAPLTVHRGAPKTFYIRNREGGSLRSFDATLVMRVTHRTGSFDLTVGNGITLSSDEDVPNALAAVRLSLEQSRLVPVGNYASYELQQTVSGQQTIVMMGRLIGKGGANPDV